MKKAWIGVVAIFTCASLTAQPGNPKGFENGSREVISGTNIKLQPATKLLIDPILPKTESPKINLKFETPDFTWNTKKVLQTIDPEKFKEKVSDTDYASNYVRLGGGNNTHLLGEVFLSNKPNKDWSYHFILTHLQANKDLPNQGPQKFKNTQLSLGGARYFNNSSIQSSLFYNRDYVSFYAQDSALYKETSPQGILANSGKITNYYGVNVDYQTLSNGKLPEIKWFTKLSQFTGVFGESSDNQSTKHLNYNELEANSIINLRKSFKKFNIWTDLEFTQIQSQQKRDTSTKGLSTLNQTYVDFRPRVQFKHDATELLVTAGFNLTYLNSLVSPKNKFFPNPVVTVEKGIKGLGMKLYGSIDGGLQKNSLRRMNQTMPFFADTLQIKNPWDMNGCIGLKGNLTKNSSFSIDFGGSSVTNMLMFVSNVDTLNKYNQRIHGLNAIYSDNVTSIFFRAFVQHTMSDKFKISARLKFINYNNPSTASSIVFHLPNMIYEINSEIKPLSNLFVTVGVNGMGTRYDQVLIKGTLNNSIQIAPFTDLHVKVDYKFSGKGRVWLQGTNLLNQKYQMWNGYSAYGLTVMAGLSLAIF